MFSVSEAEAAAIRAVYEQRGELSAAVELRRRFPGIVDNIQARECACIIASWKPPALADCTLFRSLRSRMQNPLRVGDIRRGQGR